MTYSVELTIDDLNFINACILGTVRRAQEKFNEMEAINITTVAAGCVTRLNESRLTTNDVMFINTCIEKTREYLLKDTVLSFKQRADGRERGWQIQQKLAGIGINRNVLNNWEG